MLFKKLSLFALSEESGLRGGQSSGGHGVDGGALKDGVCGDTSGGSLGEGSQTGDDRLLRGAERRRGATRAEGAVAGATTSAGGAAHADAAAR